MSNQIGNHQCNNQLLSVLPRLPSFFASPLSIAPFFDRVLPQATNRGEINEVIEQADRHHPTTLSSMEAPVFRRKINASARGTMGRARFLSSLPSLLEPKSPLRRRDSTIKFTAGIYVKEISFLDTCVYKGEIFERENILDLRTYIITDR